MLELLDTAVDRYGLEASKLTFLPASRYDASIFPTIGQYDWFSGQLLYCLVRHVKPVRVIEVSTSSGYSGLFSALALQANGMGTLETFELIPAVAAAAQANFHRFGVVQVVNLHVGDARETAQQLVSQRQGKADREILFLDSEHTEDFARFYLSTFLPDTHPESLFHMHDILPPDARVMYRPGEAMDTRTFALKRFVYKVLRKTSPRLAPSDMRRWVKPVPLNVSLSSEARLGHHLSRRIAEESQAYLHRLVDRYPTLRGRQYDDASVWRCDEHGKPAEWNDSWWAVCGPLSRA